MKYPNIIKLKWIVSAVLSLLLTVSISAQFIPPPPVIINEISYRTETPGDFTEYIELYNTTSSPINIGGWFLVEAVNYQIPANTTIQGDGFVIIAQNVSDFNDHFSNNGAPVRGPWSGALRNSGEDIILRDASFNRVDQVDYDNWNEWPSTGHLEDVNLSLQLVNINLPGNHGGSWDAADHTPGAFNSAVYINNPNQRPIIQNVRRSPDSPLSTEEVRVRAEIDNDNLSLINGLQVVLEYKKLSPGNFEPKSSPSYNMDWISVNMLDNGIGADSTANNGVFTAVIPSSAHSHRDLVRYRVKISNNSGFDMTYPDQNYEECNYAYYVYDGYPTQGNIDLNSLPPIQDFTVFTTSITTSLFIGDDEGDHIGGPSGIDQYQDDEFLGTGAVVYDGRVYDHVNFRPRGGGSRPERIKPGIRFRMNREHSFETQDDCGNTYDVDRGRMVLSGGWVHDPGAHGLTESLIYKTIELVGGIERNANYTQLRIVDDAQETGNKGDFWGLYLILENYNGDLIDERNQLEEGNFWNTDRTVSGRPRQLNYTGHFPDSETIEPWAAPEFFNSSNGRLGMDNDLNLEMMFADRIANVIYGQQGTNYVGKHSYNEYYNSVTGKYFVWWSDMDNSFGADQQFEDNPVFTRDQCDPNRHLDNRVYVTGAQQIDYQNQMRCVYDLLLNDEQIDFLIDQEKWLIHTDGTSDDWMEVDQARWGHTYDATSPTSPNQTADAHVDWYRQWFRDRRDYMEMNDGPHNEAIEDGYDTPDHIFDPNIPNTPVLTKLSANNAIDDLDFRRSAFQDPNGNNTYAAQEWRIAEWSDPSNPFYIARCTPHYEIETTWESGELLGTSRDFSFDDAVSELEAGRTYKVRVRVMDDSGRWSHWSDAITFIAEEAITPTEDNIVISEIHYNPALGCAEFIEIYNNSNSTIMLANYRFSDGVTFVFPAGSSIDAGDYKVIVEDITCFNAAFNVPSQDILGEFDSGSLRNSGEEVKLESPNSTPLDSVNYDDDLPWDTLADNGLHSLALIDLQLDNDIAVNWATQCVSVTPAAPNDFNGCNTLPDLSALVINEIKYTGGANNLEFIELKNTGTTPVDIQGMQVSGVELQILDSHIIPPGGFILLAEDTASVALNYQVTAAIQYPGSLSNSGETIELTDFFGNMVDAVSYDTGFPWPILGNSNQSIGLIDCNLDNNTFVNWATQNQLVTPLAENTFGANAVADYSSLIINEIHYVTQFNDRVEYIEIYNTGFQPIFLAGLHFSNVNFTFSESDLLFGNSYFVIAEFASDFTNAFGFTPDASWEGAGGGLSSNGELIRLLDFFGNEIDRVNYSPSWDPRSDDGVHSLALRPNQTNNNIASAWSIQCDLVTPRAANNFDDDDDTVCNDADVCPNFDDTDIGTACDDGDPCTTNDFIISNCNCVGTPSADSDNDGVCDALDICPNLDDNVIGTSCDDGDDCTSNDTWNSSCNCVGTPIADSDNDGVCNIFDTCPNFDDNLIGTSCDDGDPCTPTTIYSNCACESVENIALNGTASQNSTLSGFSASRLNDGDTSISSSTEVLAHTTGNTLNDWMQIDLGSSMLISTVVLHNRIGCCEERINNAFVMISNTPFPGNTDLSQSLSNATSFEQLRDESGKEIIGVDFNVTGRYVRIQKSGNNDGSDALNLREIEVFTPFTPSDIDNDGICDDLDSCDVMIGQPCDDNILCFTGSTYDANCNCTGGVFTDSDNDGTCDPLDQCPGMDDEIDNNNNNIPDCAEGCLNSLIQSDFPLITTDRSVNFDISTNGTVLSGFDIEYNAGQQILLTPGFEVTENAVFHAYIAPCSN